MTGVWIQNMYKRSEWTGIMLIEWPGMLANEVETIPLAYNIELLGVSSNIIGFDAFASNIRLLNTSLQGA